MFFRQDRLSFVGEGQCPAFPSISFPLCCRQRRTASGKRVENPTVRQTNFADLPHGFLRLYVVRPAWNHPLPSFMPCVLLRRALLVTPRAFRVTSQNLLNMQKAARFMQRAAFSFMRFLRHFGLRIVDHLHLSIGEIERFHVLHLFDLCVNHRFKRRRVEPDSVLAENLLRIRQLLVAIACAV